MKYRKKKPYFMKFDLWVLFIILLFNFKSAEAATSRFLAAGGLGITTTTNAQGSSSSRTETESPGGFSLAFDRKFSGPYYIFVEHMRSLGGTGSSTGLTGLGLKYYPWINPDFVNAINVTGEKSNMSMYGYFPYFGLSVGFGQSSLLAERASDSVLAVGFYANFKSGIEYPISEKWGLLAETNIASSTISSGSILVFNILGGFYFEL